MGLSDIATGLFSGGDDDGDEEGLDGDFGDEELGDDDEFGDLGGWDDEGDEFEDFGESGGGAASDLEPRLDELEKEIEGVTSTMGTVRSENEAINETVEDIEDNVRKLLEIYEMVTRGVNPFVDEAEGAAGMGGSFDLFDDGGGGGGEEIDADVADAEADSFFDDDWDEDEFDEEMDDEFDDELDEEDGESSSGDGKTFDELKSEYEEGGADWSEDDDEGEDVDDAFDDDLDEGFDDELDEGFDEELETDADDETNEAESTDGQTSATTDARERDDGKPYLSELPTGYASDLLVIEWLSNLRSASSTPETFRAIRYYETIDWIGPAAAESLTQYLTGLGEEEQRPGLSGGVPLPGNDGPTQLTVDHHAKSLGYIARLGGADIQLDRLEWNGSAEHTPRPEGGKQRGIQR